MVCLPPSSRRQLPPRLKRLPHRRGVPLNVPFPVDRIVRERRVFLHVHGPEERAHRGFRAGEARVYFAHRHPADKQQQSLAPERSRRNRPLVHVLFRPEGLAPVDHELDLTAHAVEIDRRRDDNAVGGPDRGVDLLHVVVHHTPARFVAGPAGLARPDLHRVEVIQHHVRTRFAAAADGLSEQGLRVPSSPGTSVEREYLHVNPIPWSSVSTFALQSAASMK